MDNEMTTYEPAEVVESTSTELSTNVEDAEMANDNSLLIGIGIGAGAVAIGSIAWKKAIKPGLKWLVGKAKNALDDKDEDKKENKDEPIDVEAKEKSVDDQPND